MTSSHSRRTAPFFMAAPPSTDDCIASSTFLRSLSRGMPRPACFPPLPSSLSVTAARPSPRSALVSAVAGEASSFAETAAAAIGCCLMAFTAVLSFLAFFAWPFLSMDVTGRDRPPTSGATSFLRFTTSPPSSLVFLRFSPFFFCFLFSLFFFLSSSSPGSSLTFCNSSTFLFFLVSMPPAFSFTVFSCFPFPVVFPSLPAPSIALFNFSTFLLFLAFPSSPAPSIAFFSLSAFIFFLAFPSSPAPSVAFFSFSPAPLLFVTSSIFFRFLLPFFSSSLPASTSPAGAPAEMPAASATTASSPLGSVAVWAPMPLACRAAITLPMSTPVSRWALRAGCRARRLCSSLAFSLEPTTARAERLSILRSNKGNAASRPAFAPCFRTPSTRVSASSTASTSAWLAPWALKGVIGWAASPIRVTRRWG
mmetsp:Transcript_37134/g.104820  ORF Transcript_37134/g.104820 Transcript_37134/m.104820 type:complete len:422 (+) Transcript_37134:122-1387(+)